MSALGSIVAQGASILWLPGAVVLSAAIIALAFDAFGRPARAAGVVVAGAALAAALSALAAWTIDPHEIIRGIYGGGGFAGNATVVYLVAAASAATGLRRLDRGRRGGVAAIIGLGAVACQALVGAVDVVVMAIALEAVALASYAIVAAGRTRIANEAAVRYFVQGSVAAGLLVFGLASAIGLGAGETSYERLMTKMTTLPVAAASVTGVLLLAALAFKAGAFPFHSWVPDAYQAVAPEAGVFLAGAPKVAAVLAMWVLFARSVWAPTEAFGNLRVAVGVVAAGSIVFGNLGALKQRDLGRMLGYSAIAQVGYALVGVASGAIGTPLLVGAYAIAAAVAFGCLQAASAGRTEALTFDEIAGIARERPVLAAVMTVSMLSLTGIPLTFGFVGKLWVFYGAVTGGWTWLAVVGVLGSVVSFGYYGRAIQAMYFREADAERRDGDTEPSSQEESVHERERLWPFALLAIALIAAGSIPLITGFEWLLRVLAV